MTITKLTAKQERVNLQAKLRRPPGFRLCPNRCAVKAAHREGHHHATGISREDFRRASDLSGHVQANTLMQVT